MDKTTEQMLTEIHLALINSKGAGCELPEVTGKHCRICPYRSMGNYYEGTDESKERLQKAEQFIGNITEAMEDYMINEELNI